MLLFREIPTVSESFCDLTRICLNLSMKIQILQHTDSDRPALIQNWVNERRHEANVVQLHKGETPQDPSTFDFLIILGGDMNTDQEREFPWLKSEKKYIEECLKMEKTTLGICLGGQLIAEVLGAQVKRNEHWEVGWHPVDFVDESPFTAMWPRKLEMFHWHECIFDLPRGAKLIAKNEATPHQAYSYGKNVFATQFHPEVDERWVLEAVEPPYPEAGKFVQTPEEVRAKLATINQNKTLFFQFLDRFSRA